ncbi:MAG: DNA-formamidopyrimidine glycosylase family protein [Polyangiaceae bacterium]
MPEGDTIFRTAATLTRAIGGKTLRRVRSTVPAVAAQSEGLAGQRIERIEPRGKNLLIFFERGGVLLTHMKMTGSWHIYRPGERWQKSERAARVVLETEDMLAVCFAAPVVEWIPKGNLERHPSLSRLGPDVLSEGFDAEEARGRLRARGEAPIGEALLMQGALAGIGNVYKSETLFLCGVDPFVTVADLSDEVLARVIETARDLMSRNLEGHPRTTTPGGPRAFIPRGGSRYWVYGRKGEPCLRCGATVEGTRLSHRPAAGAEKAPPGEAARVTFYCPDCQPPGARGEIA